MLFSGGFGRAFAFIVEYPRLLVDAMTLSGAAVAGQWFIYSQVKEFGALVFAATMNVRQVSRAMSRTLKITKTSPKEPPSRTNYLLKVATLRNA